MKNSNIEWCDHTFNPWEGCTKVSPGCLHCYAEARNARWNGGQAPNWGKGAPRRRTSDANWAQMVKLNREAGKLPPADAADEREWHRPRVFCASLADWLDEEVPSEWLSDLLNLIRATPNLDWLLLTKRPEKFQSRLFTVALLGDIGGLIAEQWLVGRPPANVWVGTTVEDQTRADERIPELLKIPARIRFLSCEPLLGPLNIHAGEKRPAGYRGYFEWVICGGESGPNARPMHPEWARSLRDQCSAAGVPFLFKQWGEWIPVNQSTPGKRYGPSDEYPNAKSTVIQMDGRQEFAFPQGAMTCLKVGKKAAGRLLDAVEHNGFPEVQS